VGTVIGWMFFANNTNGFNSTGLRVLTTTA
jgi:hypothetical protein